MAVVAKKVVRLEDVAYTHSEDPDSLFGVRTLSEDGNSHKGSLVNTAFTGVTSELMAAMSDSLSPLTDGGQDDGESLQSEAKDKVMPLPENWPHIARLQEKHSWDYTTTIEPSIQKATSHLELLQTIIEEWNNEKKHTAQTRQSAIKKPKQEQPSQKKPYHFPTEDVIKSSSDLSVHGLGAKTDGAPKRATVVEAPPQMDIPFLGAEEVIDEVVLLLGKMESDRKDTLQALTKERERYEMLRSKIDGYAMQRMLDLPQAVQKEHEACAMDINELNWHVSYRGRIEDRNKRKVEVSEVLNARLKEDISFVNEHIPLVKEKLDLEVDAMERIRLAQIDADEELDTTMQRFRKVDAKSTEAHTKAEQERNSIKKDLDTVRDDLKKIINELEEARKTYESYVQQINDNRKKLHDNKEEIKVLLVTDENMKAAEALQCAKVQQLESQIKQKEFEHKTLEDANIAVMTKIDENAAKFSKKEKEMRDNIAEKEENLRQLTRQFDEITMDNGDLNRKIADCDRQKNADEKNLERMKKEYEKTEEQLTITKEDLGNVFIINSAVKEQLQNDEEKCIHAEEALKATTETLKKQVKEEIHTRTVLAGHINSHNTELELGHKEVKEKREMIDSKLAEVEKAVEIVLKKVMKLRSYHEEKTKVIASMKQELQNITDKKKEINEMSQKKLQELSQPHTELKGKVDAECKKLDQIVRNSDMMNKKIKGMDESSAMMNKAVDKTVEAIDTLEADLKELNIKIEEGQRIEKGLHAEVTSITERIESLKNIHSDHMMERQNVLQDLENKLKSNMESNTVLAAKYRHLQNKHVTVKNKMLNKYEGRVRQENTVKDLKQIQALQKRMHTALLEYLKYRGLYCKSELQRMEEDSHRNGVKVGNLQDQMDEALEKITFFLTHQLSGDSSRKMAMSKDTEGNDVKSTEQMPAVHSLSTTLVNSSITAS